MATIAAARRLLSLPFRVGGRTTSQLIYHQRQQQQSRWCHVFPSLPLSFQASTYCTNVTSDPPADPGKPEETKQGNFSRAKVYQSVIAADLDGAYSLMQQSGSKPLENKLKHLIKYHFHSGVKKE